MIYSTGSLICTDNEQTIFTPAVNTETIPCELFQEKLFFIVLCCRKI